jgi:thiol-disulfide isomerase/thioredoxin
MKKLFVIYTLLLILVLSLVACGPANDNAKRGFYIQGKLKNAGQISSLALHELTPTGLILLDTAAVGADGSFTMQGVLPERTFCIIRFENNGDIALVVDTNANFNLEIDANNTADYSVSGPEENKQLKSLFNLNTSFFKSGQTVEKRFEKYTPETMTQEVEAEIRKAFDSLQSAHQDALMSMTETMASSFTALFATNFLLPDAPLSFLKLVDEKAQKNFPNSKYSNLLHSKVETLKKTDIGAAAPEISLSDPFGKTVSLSSFAGKIVLIDFWASWCAPCREDNPKNVALYNKYKSKGFEIFGVSLDDNRDAWVGAINKDKLLWTHGSDLQKWNSSLVGKYGIDAIPHTVLVDKDGKIIATKLRDEALENKLKEIFGF